MKTVNLKGKEYVPVNERIRLLHEATGEDQVNILTKVTFKEGWAYVKARLEFNKGVFNGHAFGKLDKEKALEKLETVAVGRALAFAGFAPDASIASYEEMEKFYDDDPLQNPGHPVNADIEI